jgi:hypothetical protein
LLRVSLVTYIIPNLPLPLPLPLTHHPTRSSRVRPLNAVLNGAICVVPTLDLRSNVETCRQPASVTDSSTRLRGRGKELLVTFRVLLSISFTILVR